MSEFVIVHGGFGGGWEWTEVAKDLRSRGHEVYTPTLTGMGERSHLGPGIGLATHVEDVLSVIEYEDLRDVVLCGASYGGMAVTGAADRIPDRIRLVIYIDALVPRDGQSGLDLLPAAFGATARAQGDAQGHGWVPIPEAILPPEGLIPTEKRSAFVARLRPQPLATFTEPIRLTGAVDHLPRAFVRCTGGALDVGGDPIAPFGVRAQDQGWLYRELNAPHDPHLFDPAGTASVLHDLEAES